MSFLHLVIVIAVLLIVLKFVRASAKLIVTAVCIAAVVWAVLYLLPELGIL